MHRLSVWSSVASIGVRRSTLSAVAVPFLMMFASRVAAQSNNPEVGTVLAAGKVIWVRATTSGAVEFFMSPGYRDALARPTVLNANLIAQWTDSVKGLKAPGTGVADARSPADAGLAFDRWVGTDSSGLEIKRDGSTILRVSDSPAREIVDLLARGAEMTQHLSAPVKAVATVVKDSVTTVAAQTTPAVTPTAEVARVSPPTPAATITIQQVAIAQPSPAPVESAAQPSVAAPALPAATVDTVAIAAPAAVQAPVPAASLGPMAAESSMPAQVPADRLPTPMLEPTLAPSVDRTIPQDAPPSDAKLEAHRAVVAVAQLQAHALPTAALLDKHIQTPLGPFVVPGAKLVDRDTQIKYCYTELGLRYDRHLTGDLTVRVTVSDAGAADTVEVTKRSWDGVAAAEVESCMRALIEDWSFDDRQPADSKTVELHFTLTPAMRTATTDGAAVQPSSQPR